jgi:predicted NBD/HSP70 family sugar kinase
LIAQNSQLILDLLEDEPDGLTRSQIRARTGLSKPTIQSLVTSLKAAGQITDDLPGRGAENGSSVGGRPPERLVLTPNAGLVIGIDVGHGHIRVATADRSGQLAGDITEDTKKDIDGIGVAALSDVVELVNESLTSRGGNPAAVRAVVIGIPAAIDRDGKVLFSDSLPSWATVNIGDELLRLLEDRFPDLDVPRSKVRVENDANLGALGERCHGAEGAENYLYIKVATGIGMGFVARGRLYRGAEGAAGEFGHVTVSPMARPFLRSLPGRPLNPCPRCSKLDCLENLASGQSILRQLNPSGERTSDQQLEEVVALATNNAVSNKAHLQAIIDAGTRIGYTLADVVRVYAPEVVVVGGLMAEAGDMLMKPIKDAVAGMKGLSAVDVRVVPTARIRRSEVEGALAMAALVAAASPRSGGAAS